MHGRVDEATAERGRIVRDAKLWLLAVWARRWLRSKHLRGVVRCNTLGRVSGLAVGVVLGKVRICAFDLYKAFTADRLITASCVVKIRGIRKEADGTVVRILVQEDLDRLAVNKGIVR